MGFMWAAITAGYTPKPIPISPLTANEPMTLHVAITVGYFWSPSLKNSTMNGSAVANPAPMRMPINPPVRLITVVSMTVIELMFPAIYGGSLAVVVFEAVMLSAYLALAWMAARERPP